MVTELVRAHRLDDCRRRHRLTNTWTLAWLTGLLAAISATTLAQGPAAPNESVVTARVTNAVLVQASSLGIAPEQPLCVLTLDVLSVKASGGMLPAIRANEPTAQVYTKDLKLTVLKDKTITAAVTRRGDERHSLLWLVRLDDPKEPR